MIGFAEAGELAEVVKEMQRKLDEAHDKLEEATGEKREYIVVSLEMIETAAGISIDMDTVWTSEDDCNIPNADYLLAKYRELIINKAAHLQFVVLPAGIDNCLYGIHTWSDQKGVLPPDTTCDACGETYGEF